MSISTRGKVRCARQTPPATFHFHRRGPIGRFEDDHYLKPTGSAMCVPFVCRSDKMRIGLGYIIASRWSPTGQAGWLTTVTDEKCIKVSLVRYADDRLALETGQDG
jgi:hypothetical protein